MDQFIQEYTKNQSRNYYKRFWANTASQNGLTVKYDGKEFLVKLEDIWMEDLGSMCGKCLCGHPIRYMFHVGHVTPIGSTCIQTMTGLTGQDLRVLVKGGDLARQDREDLIKTIEYYGGSFKKQLETDLVLKERYDFVSKEDCVPEDIQKFVEKDCPLPNPMKNIIYRIFNEKAKILRVKQTYGEEVYQMSREYNDLVQLWRTNGKTPPFIQTIKDIGDKIVDMRATGKAVEFFKKLYVRAKNPKLMDAYDVLLRLRHHELGEFWTNLIEDYLRKGEQYGLTDGQIKLILEKSSTGKPSIAERFGKQIMEGPLQYDARIERTGDNEDEDASPDLDPLNDGETAAPANAEEAKEETSEGFF